MKEILSILLEEFESQLPTLSDSVPRTLDFPDVSGMINVAIGIRRGGKTYLIYQKIRELLAAGIPFERILFINFEDERLLPMNQKELGKLLDSFYELYPQNHEKECYFFLDEIQNIEGWPLVVRRFHDKKKLKIFLTGSSAKLLSKEIATSLRGRSIATEVWPYSFPEYWKAHGIKKPKGPIGKQKMDLFSQHLTDYFWIGGFPAVQRLHENERVANLQSYVDTLVFRDVIERYKISNTSLVRYMIKSLIQNVSAPFTVHKLYRDIKSQGIKVGKDTLYQYLDYIEDTFLVSTVPLFSHSIRKKQVNPKKVYIADCGLVTAHRLGRTLPMGNLFENQVYLDLRREGKKVHYYLTEKGDEVDFVVENRDGSFELIQVVWDESDEETRAREERALENAEKELGIKGTIITPKDYVRAMLSA